MHDSPATAHLKKMIKRNEFYYSSTPVVKDNRASHMYDMYKNNNQKQMMAMFLDSCSSSSCSCVQSRLLGPSDTYSTTSSQRSYPVNLMSGSSTSSSISASQKWVLPPYTPVDPKHYVNMPPVYRPTTMEIKVQRTSRKSVWLGLIFGFSIFLLLVLGAVFAYSLEQGMI